jgi:hypothetical protein
MSKEDDPNRELAQQRPNLGKDPGPFYRISLLSYGCFFGAIGGHSEKFGDWFTIIASVFFLVTMLVNVIGYLARKTRPGTAPKD